MERRNSREKGGLKLYYQFWMAEKVRAAIVVTHGLAEYSGKCKHLAEHFSKEGISFYALDNKGHGLSEGESGCVENFDNYVDDLDIFITEIVKNKEGEKKIILLGHCMGGTIALLYALKNPKKINYFILSSHETVKRS